MTSYASLDRSILALGSQLTSDPWFQTTLVDTYFGLITFYFWVAYKEARVRNKVLWFVLIMTLGNIATSIYMLIQPLSFGRAATAALTGRITVRDSRFYRALVLGGGVFAWKSSVRSEHPTIRQIHRHLPRARWGRTKSGHCC